MTEYPLRAAALDEEGCAAVHAATIELLEHTGVEVQHDEALALLRRPAPAWTARASGSRGPSLTTRWSARRAASR